ncbi:uncharacterized protein LOC142771352 isoform X2 [Rhipicephalus microplus]|uniref:uncharacterized protein LOC142771352 isoform X2 n=1 Tax=Rhipicephalus microplus TaxID=6941 RepID=UPI003F6D20AC
MCVMHYRQAADIRRFFAFGVPCAAPFAHVRTRWTAFLLAVHRRDQGQEKREKTPLHSPKQSFLPVLHWLNLIFSKQQSWFLVFGLP